MQVIDSPTQWNGQPWGSNGVTVGGGGANTVGNRIYLSPAVYKSLMNYRNPVLGLLGLTTLLHETVHSMANYKNPGGIGGSDGFGSEWSAPALGAQLIPDMLQRFMGIPMNSKAGRAYWRNVQQFMGNRLGPAPPAYGIQPTSLAPTSLPGYG